MMSAQDSGVHSFNKCVRTWWVAVATRVGGVLSSTQIWQLGTRTGSGGSWSWWHAHAWLWGPALGSCIVGRAAYRYTQWWGPGPTKGLGQLFVYWQPWNTWLSACTPVTESPHECIHSSRGWGRESGRVIQVQMEELAVAEISGSG